MFHFGHLPLNTSFSLMSDSESVTSVVEQMEIGGGNTKLHQKRVSQGKKWCFTYNNYPDDALEIMERNFVLHDLEYIVGVEVGESGTPHLQGFIESTKRLRPDQLGLSRKIHWEKAKGTLKQNVAYCSKDGDVRHSRGCKPKRPLKVLSDSQLYAWQKGIVADLDTEPDDRTLNWLWSLAGNVGKTTFCKYLSHKFGAIALGGKAADCRMGVVHHLEKHGDTPEIVLIPIPRSFDPQYVSYEAMENIKDMYFFSGKYEGGMVNGNCPHVYVFSNFPPDESKMSEDRWNVVQIDAPNDLKRKRT